MKNSEIPLQANCIYHVYNHANGSENLFRETENYFFFLQKYAYYIEPIATTLAYCLMPNHLHLMIRIKDNEALQAANKYFILNKQPALQNIPELSEEEIQAFLSKTFGRLFSSYTQSFNKKYDRMGSLFMPNFKRKEIDSEDYYTKLIHYIHNNPVHHGFVPTIDDWQFSSYHAFLLDKTTKLGKAEVLAWFGNLNAFRQFHATQKVDFSFEF